MRDLTKSTTSRRSFMAGSGLLAGSALLAACGSSSTSSRGSATKSGPLTFYSWPYTPGVIQSHVNGFEKLHGLKVESSSIPYGNYYTSLGTRMSGGQFPDVMYAEETYLYRWYKSGYITALDTIQSKWPGTDYKKWIYPANYGEMSAEGHFLGLAYYAGYIAFIYNKELLDRANLQPATTWAELLDQLRQLKQDGISQHPFTMAWTNGGSGLTWSLPAFMYSEGEYMFDENNNPTFQDSSIWSRQMQYLKSLFDEQLVPTDALVAAQESVPDFGTGTVAYMLIHDYDQQGLNTDTSSFKTAPGKVGNALMPGKTGTTYAWTSMISMGAGLSGKRQEQAWDLLQYMGGRDPNGQYIVPKNWALETGLGDPYSAVNNDPDVVAAWSKWRNMDVHREQLKKSRGRAAEKTLWWPEFDSFEVSTVQTYLQGKASLSDTTKALVDQHKTLVKKYAK